MNTQPIPVAAVTIPTPSTVDDAPSKCRHCGAVVDMAETLNLYRRHGRIVAVGCIPCGRARDRA